MYKLGKTDDAVNYWKKAKDSGDKEIENLDKKIGERKLEE
jgi:hypothetical protein